MKAVHLDKIRTSEKSSVYEYKKQHCVNLGNGQEYYFKNIHDAKAFLASTNRFLNLKLMEINRVHIDLWSAYRIIFVEQSPVFIQSGIDNQFHIVERSINMTLRQYQTPNKNEFIFHWFATSIETLKDICTAINQTLKEKNRHYNTYEFTIIFERLEFLEQSLRNWGHEYTSNNPPIFYKLKFQTNEKSK